MEVGLRVVRGKDWKWGNQDGGEGGVGTVVEVGGKGGKSPKNTVVVVWDVGARANYRAGHQGADDLRVLDSASAGVRHTTVNCDICKESGIIGTRWNCEICHDFDLCHGCYMGAKHDLSHTFTRWDTPLSYGVKVPARTGSRRVQAKGIYSGANVIRGINWNYGNQDGGSGKNGVVQSIGGSSEGNSWRSWVKIKWDAGTANDYRRGHEGNIDVKCTQLANGESYYIDHLVNTSDYASNAFCAGDQVKLNERQLSDAEKKAFARILGKTGKVIIDQDTQQIYLQFKGFENVLRLPTAYLMKTQTFRKGDTVMISNDRQQVIRLQEGHGGWNDQMQSCLGMEANVLGTDSDGDVKVSVNGKKWILNADALTLLYRGTEDTEDDDDNDNDDGGNDNDGDVSNFGASFLNHFLKALLDEAVGQALGPQDLIKSAAEGNLAAVQAIIKRHPSQVDFKAKDMTPLQVAAHQGHLQVVIALANAGARLDMQDSNGDNVLHFATIGGQPEVLEVLAKHKPQLVNSRNNDMRTCLHLAVIKQFPRCLEVALKYNADVNIQDTNGETSLHLAVERPDVGIQTQLINHPKVDIKLKNNKGFNAIHSATLKNSVDALRKLIQKAPTLVNVSKSDGYTALHIATINGYKSAAEVLISSGKANMNMKNDESFTALLLAVNQGRCSMIELLVNKGADINAEDKDGDTPLHLAVNRLKSPAASDLFTLAILNIVLDNQKPKDLDQAPAITKICSELPGPVRQNRSWVAICCFLLQNGAELEKKNHSGASVGDIISDGLKQIFSKYIKPRKVEQPVRVASARPQTASANPPTSPSSSSPKCMMCLTADADMVFYPCGHRVTCNNCSSRMKACFSCHEKIQEKVKKPPEPPAEDIRRPRKTSSNNVASAESIRRNRMAGDSVNCPLCETNVRNVVFLCGHSCCKDCAEPLDSCHVCSQTITRKLTLM